MKYPAVSLIISFYNRMDYLRMIMATLENQSFKDFEVIIADDGSAPEVVEEIKVLQKSSSLRIQHAWHEDIGFRKTTILNEAIRRSQSEYLIFVDGDCILHPKFIEEHFSNRAKNTILAGRRANISPALRALLSPEKLAEGILTNGFSLRIIWDGIVGKSTHGIKGLYITNRWLRKFLNRKITGVLGSNFSIHTADILAVNGFDERYKSPAIGEDTDLEARLRWHGVVVKMVKNVAVQYHFDHPKLYRASANEEIFREVVSLKQFYTPYGVRPLRTQ
jgi:glycosyltransferase involved in cell wall biosynthesis